MHGVRRFLMNIEINLLYLNEFETILKQSIKSKLGLLLTKEEGVQSAIKIQTL